LEESAADDHKEIRPDGPAKARLWKATGTTAALQPLLTPA
jgi:hypothetical protein